MNKKYFALVALALLSCCSFQQSARTSQQDGSANSRQQQAKGTPAEQFGRQELLMRLKSELGIEQPFAWGVFSAIKKGIQVVGIGQDGRLKKAYCFEAGDGYELKTGEHKFNEPVKKSGDLELSEYITDAEFPFDAKIITAGDCKVHFISLWQATSRSFTEPYLALDVVSVRMIVEKDHQVISSRIEEGYDIALVQASLEDVNGDGKTDFLLITNTMQKTAIIWSVGPGCDVKRLPFKHENSKTTDLMGGKDVFLTRDGPHGAYRIHGINSEPVSKNGKTYFEETESIFTWDSDESVFKLEKTSRRLKP
jgi:hypothetical protein